MADRKTHVMIENGRVIAVYRIAEMSMSDDFDFTMVLTDGEVIQWPVLSAYGRPTWWMSDHPSTGPSPALTAKSLEDAMANIRWREFARYAGYDNHRDAPHLRPFVVRPVDPIDPEKEKAASAAMRAAGCTPDVTLETVARNGNNQIFDGSAEENGGRRKNQLPRDANGNPISSTPEEAERMEFVKKTEAMREHWQKSARLGDRDGFRDPTGEKE